MPPFILCSLLFIPVFPSLVGAQGPVQTLFPAAIPLAVKTPYMNVWHESTNTSAPLSFSSQHFWDLQANMGWAGKIKVNGAMYRWMGEDGNDTPTNITNIQITPTRSIFVMQAGSINVTVTFLSPVEPDDWVRQSIPFSYVSVEAHSLDGNSYSVQLYSDITADWVSGDRSSKIWWSNTNTGSSIYHKIELQSPRRDFEEFVDQAQDGTVYYAISTSQPHITWQIDRDETARSGFQTNGFLTNTASTAFSSISPNYTVFAFAVDLGTIQSTASPITWSVGYVRDPVVPYTTATGATQLRRPYYVTEYANISDVIDAFTGDFARAHDRAVALDQKITSAALQISSQYSDIVSLATRQTMGSLDFTVGINSSGHLVPGDIKVFMKNLGTDGRVNPVEHLFASFPMLLYLNASICGALLEPLLELQVGRTGVPYAAQDLGEHYPVVSGPTMAPTQGVEQSGNMLIMELAHATILGTGTLLSQYYNTTKRWADYLVNNSLGSESQTNSDKGLAGSVNIALKGVIGVKAKAEIAHAVGEDLDAEHYSNQSSALLTSWLSLATSLSGSHLLGGYGEEQSWSLMYNLFSDKMLGLNFVPHSVIDLQTNSLSSLSENTFQWGLPIDSSPGQNANAAWALFASAFVSDTTVRNNLIGSVYNHANSNQSVGIFSERYNVTNNSATNGWAGPALGGLFSHLVLTVPNKTISQAAPTGGSGARSNLSAIAGGVIGGLAIVGVIAAIFVVYRKRRRDRCEGAETAEVAEQAPHHPTLTPYCIESTTGSTIQRTHGVGSVSYNAPVHVRNGTIMPFAGIRTGNLGVRYWHRPASTTVAEVPDTGEGTAVSLLPGPSSKMCDVPSNRSERDTPFETVATSSHISLQTGTVSRSDLSLGLGGSYSRSSTDMAGLRTEVENLRRVLLEIQEDWLEPPPEYTES